jgi:DNA-binding NtrC family response regulator
VSNGVHEGASARDVIESRRTARRGAAGDRHARLPDPEYTEIAVSETLETGAGLGGEAALRAAAPVPMLVIAWCSPGFDRAGEVLVPDSTPQVFGRSGDPASEEGDAPRLQLLRQRPGGNARTAPLDNPFLSRSQLRVTREGDGVRVENLGKRALLVRGQPVNDAVLSPGDTCEVKGHLLFLCARRPRVFPDLQSQPRYPSFEFGAADPFGIVGESAAAWELRDQIAFVARRAAHVLLLGESGSGKELVARALHALSSRKDRKLVARNAATLPSGLIDAELFGNVANYPNAGMPERLGLVGEAHGSTLFLDEIGELSTELQTHLLRVLDKGGEYQRLGDARARTADIRLVAATNRAVSALKHDLAARMRLRLSLQGLNERREDIPLLLRHVLRRDAADDAEIQRRFFEGGEPRVSAALVEALVLHQYETHARELDALVWRSLATSKGDTAELTDEVHEELALPKDARAARTTEVTAEEIQASLDKHGGVQEKVWRDLGLGSRHVLTRLLRKHGLSGKAK